MVHGRLLRRELPFIQNPAAAGATGIGATFGSWSQLKDMGFIGQPSTKLRVDDQVDAKVKRGYGGGVRPVPRRDVPSRTVPDWTYTPSKVEYKGRYYNRVHISDYVDAVVVPRRDPVFKTIPIPGKPRYLPVPLPQKPTPGKDKWPKPVPPPWEAKEQPCRMVWVNGRQIKVCGRKFR